MYSYFLFSFSVCSEGALQSSQMMLKLGMHSVRLQCARGNLFSRLSPQLHDVDKLAVDSCHQEKLLSTINHISKQRTSMFPPNGRALQQTDLLRVAGDSRLHRMAHRTAEIEWKEDRVDETKLNISDDVEKLSEDDEKRLEIYKLEYELWYVSGTVRVPETMTDSMWLTVLRECPSLSARKNIYKFWLKKEAFKKIGKEKKIEKYKLLEKSASEVQVWNKNVFPYISDSALRNWKNAKLIHAMQFGPQLVIDFDFDDLMSRKEHSALMRQLKLSIGANNDSPEPFHFHFCNLSESSRSYDHLCQNFNLDNLLCKVSSKSYMEYYSPDDIVYLTPDSPKVLHRFNPTAVYIVGALVDKGAKYPRTLAKAKREQLKTARLPLDQYLR